MLDLDRSAGSAGSAETDVDLRRVAAKSVAEKAPAAKRRKVVEIGTMTRILSKNALTEFLN